MKKSVVTFILCLISGFVFAKYVIYTANGELNKSKTPLDSELVENLRTGTGTLVYDGRTYNTVIIDGKEWMAENLAYLPSVSPLTTGSAITPHYYVYGYSGTDVATAKQQSNYTTYGVLYNWPAAKAACPPGWHLPSDDEWKQLEMALGMTRSEADETGERGTNQSKQMKTTSGWESRSGTNTSGFSGLPGGCRFDNGTFIELGECGYWWSSTEYSANGAWYRRLYYFGNHYVIRDSYNKELGFSVRCVRD